MDRTILLDIDVQNDFFSPRGLLSNPQSKDVISNIQKLYKWVKEQDFFVISTVIRFRQEWDCPFPRAVCMEDTEGEKKVRSTIMSSCVGFGSRDTTDLPEDIFDQYRQIIFEKKSTDIFHHKRFERLVCDMKSGRFIVCGAGITFGIAEAVIGLRTLGFPVIVASDAILPVTESSDDELAIMRMMAKGAMFFPTEKIIESPQKKGGVVPWKTTKDTIKPGRRR